MKPLIIFFLGISLAACMPAEPLPGIGSPDNQMRSMRSDTVYCEYKYDNRYNIEFIESEKEVTHPAAFPELTIYQIVDIRGNKWSINEYEWENYKCSLNGRK